MKVEWDLPYYTTKIDLKGATSIDTSNLASRCDVLRLKAEVDILDVEKLKTAFTDLTKLGTEQIMMLLNKMRIINYSLRVVLLILLSFF